MKEKDEHSIIAVLYQFAMVEKSNGSLLRWMAMTTKTMIMTMMIARAYNGNGNKDIEQGLVFRM